MKALLAATALAGALAVTPIAALAQQDPGQAGAPETQATPAPQAETPEATAGEAGARDYRIITSSQDLEALDFSEVRVESVEEVPRDHVMAIVSSLDPANQEAAALRQRLGEIDEFEQALSEENIELERVVGAALDDNDLVVYFLPEGETRETWGAQMPDPTTDAEPGAAATDSPAETGAPGAEERPGAGGSAY
jgi:hypothetical protein